MPGCVRSATSWCPRLGSSPACTTTTVRCRTSPPTAYAAAWPPSVTARRWRIHPTRRTWPRSNSFTHCRSLRVAPTPVRRILAGATFIEGWAHYAEELFVEDGFHADDPRFAIGVAVEALIRVTRFACAIGIHTGAMTVDDAAARFGTDGLLAGPAARSEAMRGTFDPTYGRYTWGQLAIRDLRTQARRLWGADYTDLRLHTALMELGSPPLGLIGTSLSPPRSD